MRQRRRTCRRRDAGFTLLEIMIVLALVGLIAGVVGKGIYERWKQGQIRTARLQVRDLVAVVQESMLDDATCPTVERLVGLGLLRKPPRDPWGTPLSLECPPKHDRDPADVVSAGPDKKIGTADDLNSWEL